MRHRLGLVIVATAALVALWAPTPALAAPPALTSASQENRVATATWTLPAGVRSQVIEVATNPATDSSGYFLFANVSIFDIPAETQTSWKATRTLAPGTYYLHVAGFDQTCLPCPVREWSQIAPIQIPPYGPCGGDHLPLIRNFVYPPSLEWRRNGVIKATAAINEGSWFFDRGVDVTVNGVPAGQFNRFDLEFSGYPVSMPVGATSVTVGFSWWEELISQYADECSQSATVTITGVQPPACRDREDNDGDGRLDLNDPGCRGNAARTSERDPRPVRSVFAFRRVTTRVGRILINRVVVRPDITPRRLFPFRGRVVLRVSGLGGSARGTSRVKRLALGFSPNWQFRNLPPGRYKLSGSYLGDRYRLRSRPDVAFITVKVPRPARAAPPPPPPPPPSGPPPRSRCDSSYPTICIPPPPPDLDCADVPYTAFRVIGRDPHGFDGDGDGVGCED